MKNVQYILDIRHKYAIKLISIFIHAFERFQKNYNLIIMVLTFFWKFYLPFTFLLNYFLVLQSVSKCKQKQ